MLSYIRNTIFGYESLSTRITPFYYVKALYSITHFGVRNTGALPEEIIVGVFDLVGLGRLSLFKPLTGRAHNLYDTIAQGLPGG